MAQEIVLYLVSFLIFVVLQAMAINGIFELFRGSKINDLIKGEIYKGNLFYMISPKFFEKNKDKFWASNLFGCVKCMSSTYSLITFFPLVIYLFGFHWEEIFIWAFDAFILVFLNYFFYKKG